VWRWGRRVRQKCSRVEACGATRAVPEGVVLRCAEWRRRGRRNLRRNEWGGRIGGFGGRDDGEGGGYEGVATAAARPYPACSAAAASGDVTIEPAQAPSAPPR